MEATTVRASTAVAEPGRSQALPRTGRARHGKVQSAREGVKP